MVHGYHLVMTAYGFWLPNDPRGSWSETIEKWDLLQFGPTTKGRERRKFCELTTDELARREASRMSLKYPSVRFMGKQALEIGHGIAAACRKSGYTIWACAIIPEHMHLVIARHRYSIERIANLLKGETTKAIKIAGVHPLAAFAIEGRMPRMWTENQWAPFLDDEAAIEAAIHYVEQNPVREGKPTQRWSFVTPFAGLSKGGWTQYH